MKIQPVISARNLEIGYPKNRKQRESSLYENLDFDLYAGELTCLLGENGAGKSSLLRTLTGIQFPLSGEIKINNKDLYKYSEQELSTLLGLVLTDKTTAGGLTVSELVALGRYPYTGFFGKLREEDHKIIKQAMEDVNISHKADSYVAELSDGERQKVMIAKALAQQCPIIILDEPTAFLDVINRIEIMNLLHHLAVTQNKTILLSSHDIELALLLADRLWLLSCAKGFKYGITEDLILSNQINEYLGSKDINFDKNSGRFVTKQITDKTIYLEAKDDLYYWTKNYLSRKGYRINDNSESELHLKIMSPNDIEYKSSNQINNLHSFEELDSFLKI